jgi:hypothetical protein
LGKKQNNLWFRADWHVSITCWGHRPIDPSTNRAIGPSGHRAIGPSGHRVVGWSGGRVGLTGHQVIKLSGCWVGLSLAGLWPGYRVLSHRFGVSLSGYYVSGRAQVLGISVMGGAVMYRVAVVIGVSVLSLAGFPLSGCHASGCGQIIGLSGERAV